MDTHRHIAADVCVVGAGILGVAHALEARARGLTVALLERSERASGASVRNFGHVIVSGMADGAPLQAAHRARERWLRHGRRAGLEVHERGTLIVARAPDELAVLEAIVADPARDAVLLTARQVTRHAPIPGDELLGGLHARSDLRVDPRRAVAALTGLLADDPGATVRFAAPVHEIASGTVHARGVRVDAPQVIVCPGPDHDWLDPALRPRRAGLTRCKLQMLRVAAPAGARYGPALLTGLSLLRYPGYSARPGTEALRARIAAERPELLAAGVHLIVTQLPGGDLVLGDTHEYSDTVSPFGDESLDELVLAEARRLLGAADLTVRERWHGVYPSAPGDPFLVELPAPGIAVCQVVSGIGMTTALGFAPLTLDALARPPSALAVGGA